MCLSIDEEEILLCETGYRKPVCSLKLVDKPSLLATLLDYHLMIKVKAEMDQFKEGLHTLGFYEDFKSNPFLWEPYFMNVNEQLTSGMNEQSECPCVQLVCLAKLNSIYRKVERPVQNQFFRERIQHKKT